MPGSDKPFDKKILTERLDVNFALQAAGLGIWEIDPTTNQVLWDERCRALIGLDRGDPDTTPFEEAIQYIHLDDRDRVLTAIQRAMEPESGGLFDESYRTVGADGGRLRWVRFWGQGYFTETGGLDRFSGVAQETTQQMIDKQQLVDQQVLLDSIIQQTPAPTLVLRGDEYLIEQINPPMLAFMGRREDVIGQPFLTIMPELDGQFAWQQVQRVYREGVDFDQSEVLVSHMRNGLLQDIYYNVSYRPLREGKQITGLIQVAIDITDRVVARKQAEETQRQLLALFEQSPVGLATYSADEAYVIQWANAFFGKLVARPPQNLLGKPLLEALPELKGQGFDDILKEVVATGSPFMATEQAVNILRDGALTTIYVDLTYQPQKGTQGSVDSILVVATDVTPQVLSRRINEESRAQLRSVIEQTPFAMGLHVGADLRIELANDTQLSYWHKDRSVIGKSFREALPELEGQGFFELFELAYATGQPQQGLAAPAQLNLNGQPGTYYFDYSFKPLRNEQGQVYAVLNTAINVTEPVLARQALEQQQAQQRFVLQLSDSIRPLSDPLAVYYQTACLVGAYLGANRVGYAEDQGDGDTIVVLRNYVDGVADLQGTYQYADYGPLLTEFLAGRTVVRSDIAHDPTLTPVQKEAHQQLQLGATLNKPLIRNGRLMAVLFIHYQQAHHWSPEELSLVDMVAERLVLAVERTQTEAALRQSEARYRHLSEELEMQVQQRTEELAAANEELAASNEELTASNEELTASYEETEATNEELTESNYYLTRSNDSLEKFAYVASHDLQEPLRKVQSFGDLLKERYGERLGEGIDYLERMQSAASRMSTLIRDLLTYSRISTQRDRSQLVSLTDVLDGVLASLELRIQETEAAVRVDPMPTVTGDPLQLEQLFQNLIGNALKFRRSGVPPIIQLRSGLVHHKNLPLSVKPAKAAKTYHRIEVIDNGVGFDEKYLDRIFEVFQRLHSKRDFEGTGIGLAICEKVAANHGGAITASSQPGQGATFSVYLPV